MSCSLSCPCWFVCSYVYVFYKHSRRLHAYSTHCKNTLHLCLFFHGRSLLYGFYHVCAPHVSCPFVCSTCLLITCVFPCLLFTAHLSILSVVSFLERAPFCQWTRGLSSPLTRSRKQLLPHMCFCHCLLLSCSISGLKLWIAFCEQLYAYLGILWIYIQSSTRWLFGHRFSWLGFRVTDWSRLSRPTGDRVLPHLYNLAACTFNFDVRVTDCSRYCGSSCAISDALHSLRRGCTAVVTQARKKKNKNTYKIEISRLQCMSLRRSCTAAVTQARKKKNLQSLSTAHATHIMQIVDRYIHVSTRWSSTKSRYLQWGVI